MRDRLPPLGPLPPPRHRSRRRRRRPARFVWSIGAAAIVVVVLLLTTIDPGSDRQTTAPTTAAGPVIPTPMPTAAPTAAPISPSPTDSAAAASPADAGANDCEEVCLVRLAVAGSPAMDALIRRGVRSVYTYDGQLWAVADSFLIATLRGEGIPVVVVQEPMDASPLYVVRTRDADQAELVVQLGTVLDQAGNQYLVRPSQTPPRVAGLAAAGVAVEQLPPPRPAPPDRTALPPLEGPAYIAGAVSLGNLEATIRSLQTMGADGGNLGSRFYTAPGNALAASEIARRMVDYGLDVWFEDFIAGDGTYATNVVGELPGRDPEKIYLIVAHYDSTAHDGDPAPGADDNASGVAAMLEIARILAPYQLNATVRFVALTGEEVGFQGAGAFVARAESARVSFAAAFNLDALGWAGRQGQLVINSDQDAAWIEEILFKIDAAFGLGEELLIRQNPNIVADDNVLRRAGIPTVLVARALYGDSPIHHTADDVVEQVDIDAVASATTLVLLTIGDLVSIYGAT